jgi:hypothetical protein
MRDLWIINYKRRCFQLKNSDNQTFKIFVTSSEKKYRLELEEDNSLTYITQSNNLQILKDLVRSLQNHIQLDIIMQHFKMLDLSNLQKIIRILT